MSTWHETMILSSDSFRQCHENKGTGNTEPVPAVLVDDYISISNQGNGQYWSMYDTDKGIEEGKNYHVIINDEEQEIMCVMGSTYPELQGEGLTIAYNQSLERYLITYYPSDYNIGNNPTVNFKIEEVEVKEPEYNLIDISHYNLLKINNIDIPCSGEASLSGSSFSNIGDNMKLFDISFLSKALVLYYGVYGQVVSFRWESEKLFITYSNGTDLHNVELSK